MPRIAHANVLIPVHSILVVSRPSTLDLGVTHLPGWGRVCVSVSLVPEFLGVGRLLFLKEIKESKDSWLCISFHFHTPKDESGETQGAHIWVGTRAMMCEV